MYLEKAFSGEYHQTLDIGGTCRTHLAAKAFSVDVADCEGKGTGSKTEGDILSMISKEDAE
jgi:hypothetical protein